VSRCRCASSSSARGETFESSPTTTSFGTNRRSPGGGTPVRGAFWAVPERPSAFGLSAGFVALDTALRTLPISEFVTEFSGGTRSTVEDTVPRTPPGASFAVPTVPLTVWSADGKPSPLEPVPPSPPAPRLAPPTPVPTLGTLRPRNCAPASVAPKQCNIAAAARIPAIRLALMESSKPPPQRNNDAFPATHFEDKNLIDLCPARCPSRPVLFRGFNASLPARNAESDGSSIKKAAPSRGAAYEWVTSPMPTFSCSS
jgi:hypothetical protein